MNLGALLVISLALSLNNFGVAVSLGTMSSGRRHVRTALIFGIFEFTVPLVGIWIGGAAASRISEWAGPIGAAMIAVIGIWTLIEALRDDRNHEQVRTRAARWAGVTVLAGGLSLDNLVIGFSLGLHGYPPFISSLVIAVTVCGLILVGLKVGTEATRRWERHARVTAGLVLLVVAWFTVADVL